MNNTRVLEAHERGDDSCVNLQIRYPLSHQFYFTVVSSQRRPIKTARMRISEAASRSRSGRRTKEGRERIKPSEEEAAVCYVTLNEDDSVSKNNLTLAVLQHFGFARQTPSPAKVPCTKKKKTNDISG